MHFNLARHLVDALILTPTWLRLNVAKLPIITKCVENRQAICASINENFGFAKEL